MRRVLPDDLSEHVTLVRNGSDDAPRPGLDLYKQGHRPKFPVVVVPGFVTSGLELWKGHECAKKYFRCAACAEAAASADAQGCCRADAPVRRQRIWGSLGMTRSFFSDIRCWLCRGRRLTASGCTLRPCTSRGPHSRRVLQPAVLAGAG